MSPPRAGMSDRCSSDPSTTVEGSHHACSVSVTLQRTDCDDLIAGSDRIGRLDLFIKVLCDAVENDALSADRATDPSGSNL